MRVKQVKDDKWALTLTSAEMEQLVSMVRLELGSEASTNEPEQKTRIAILAALNAAW